MKPNVLHYVVVLSCLLALQILGAASAGPLAGNMFLITSVRTGDTEVFSVDPDTGDAVTLAFLGQSSKALDQSRPRKMPPDTPGPAARRPAPRSCRRNDGIARQGQAERNGEHNLRISRSQRRLDRKQNYACR